MHLGILAAIIWWLCKIAGLLKTSRAIGFIEADGLEKNGNVFTNKAYGRTKATINIKVTSGIGTIELKTRRPKSAGAI